MPAVLALAALGVVLANAGGASSSAAPPRPPSTAIDVVPVPGGNMVVERGARVSQDRVLVRFAPGASAAQRDDLRSTLGAKLVRSYRLVPRLELLRVKPGTVFTAVDRLNRSANVQYAEPDVLHRIAASPDDPMFSSQWDMNAINAPSAWDHTTGSATVTVAVIDTGADVNHPDLAANIWTNSGEIPGNDVDDDSNGYVDDVHGWNFDAHTNAPTDGYGHGTHVAGTIGAVGDNSLGVTGVNWNVRVMPLKICSDQGFCSTADEVTALQYAVANGATIANASFGGPAQDPAEKDAIQAAGADGLLYVAAAGNNASNDDNIGFYPAGYPLDNIISVAATSQLNSLASFSNFGAQTVDIAAPGQSILSTMVTSGVLADPSGYGYLSGTSMAAPHVAGAAALLWSEHPTWTMAEIRDRLLSTAAPLGAVAGKVRSCGQLDIGAATDSGVDDRELVCIAPRGTGAGSITSSPAGIDCGDTCAASFPPDTDVTLTATPAAGSTFVGWSGAGCSGTGQCVVSSSAIALVTPSFTSPGSPSGWAQSTIAPPAARPAYVFGSPTNLSFYRTSMSADGTVRAHTIFNRPEFMCSYDTTNTGGVYIERKSGSSWVDDGTVTAPAVYGFDESPDAPGGARWTNCSDFGRTTQLSADGNSLLVAQPMSATSGPVAGRYRCMAFVYRHGSGGWTLDGTLMPPGVDAAGSTDPSVCNYFGDHGAISADGTRVAISGGGFTDVFVRGSGGWTHEQRLTYPAGTGCGDGTTIALSGDAATLIAGDPFCASNGLAYAYTRTGSTWALDTTIAAPEPVSQSQFGVRVALSRDGSTAAISGVVGSSLPQYAGAAWIYEHDGAGWHLRTRLTATTPKDIGGFGCDLLSAHGERAICTAPPEKVGSNDRQGALYVADRPAGGWAAGAPTKRAFATSGAPYDQMGPPSTNDLGTSIDDVIFPDNNGNGTYPNDRLGYEFTLPPTDGTGSISASPSAVRSNVTGNTLTFTYTAAGALSNAAVTINVPSGWSVPSTVGTDAGFFTASTGTTAVSGNQMIVNGVTLAAGAKLTVVYGSKAQSGPGATSPPNGAVQTWNTKERSSASGSLAPVAGGGPTVTVLARDGSGTMASSPTVVRGASTGNTLALTYTVATGGISNGTVTITVPNGWSAPSTTTTAPGFFTSSAGTRSVSSGQMVITGLTLAGGAKLTVVYGSKSQGGPGAGSPATGGAQLWQARERSSSAGTMTVLATSPSISVLAPDGSGTAAASPASIRANTTGNTLTFTYTAAAGGMSNGAVAIAVPSGWSAPSTTGTAAGFFTASAGTRSVSSGQMVVSGVTLAAGAKLTVVYGAKAQGGPGATSPSTGSTQTWTTRQRSSSAGSSTVLAAGSPSVTVFAPDGSGSMTPSQSTVAHAVTGKTLTFTYSVAAGGMSNGTLTLVVPSGWSVPSTTGSAPGYVTAGTGTVVVSNRTITVSGITRAGGTTVSITYGSKAAGGPGATAPPTAVGAQTWQARQRSTGAGTLTNLATSPSITVT